MGVCWQRAMLAGAVLAALIGTGPVARAAAASTPAPSAEAEAAAAIVTPLAEIGRVRARTPYCAALARARPGIDAAITYEYTVPVVAQDLRNFRLDSALHKELSLKNTERDLNKLWDLAVAGREEVRALRTAANAEPDAPRRTAMLDFANALDGAKERQKWLAKSIARVVAVMGEANVRDVVDSASFDTSTAAFVGQQRSGVRAGDDGPISAVTQTQADAIEDHERLQRLFGAFAAEWFIRNDLRDASIHARTAMALGGCDSL